MATHSSVLTWRIPGTVEPGGLPSNGSHRVGHNWSDLAAAAAVISVAGRLFMFLWAICCFFVCLFVFLRNVYSSLVPIFKLDSFLLSCRSSLCILDINPFLHMTCKCFLPFCGLPFQSIYSIFWCTKVLNFDEVKFIYLCFCCLNVWLSYPRNYCQIQCHKLFPCVFS